MASSYSLHKFHHFIPFCPKTVLSCLFGRRNTLACSRIPSLMSSLFSLQYLFQFIQLSIPSNMIWNVIIPWYIIYLYCTYIVIWYKIIYSIQYKYRISSLVYQKGQSQSIHQHWMLITSIWIGSVFLSRKAKFTNLIALISLITTIQLFKRYWWL